MTMTVILRERMGAASSWWVRARLVGVWPVAGTAVVTLAGWRWLEAWEAPGWTPLGVLALVLSLLVGWQSAFLLAPDQERPLELLGSTSTSLRRVLLGRLGLLAGMQGGTAVILTILAFAWWPPEMRGAENMLWGVLRWLSPAFFLAGLVTLAVQLTRQGALGALLAVMTWLGASFSGDALLRRWPSYELIHLFLPPELTSPAGYGVNRALLLLLGGLMMAGAVYLLRDEERALGWQTGRPLWKSGRHLSSE